MYNCYLYLFCYSLLIVCIWLVSQFLTIAISSYAFLITQWFVLFVLNIIHILHLESICLVPNIYIIFFLHSCTMVHHCFSLISIFSFVLHRSSPSFQPVYNLEELAGDPTLCVTWQEQIFFFLFSPPIHVTVPAHVTCS